VKGPARRPAGAKCLGRVCGGLRVLMR
jgi:hypothetical protein